MQDTVSTVNCTICQQSPMPLRSVKEYDKDNIKLLDKLAKCIPDVPWNETDLICTSCIRLLNKFNNFRKTCMESCRLRRQQDRQQREQSLKRIESVTTQLEGNSSQTIAVHNNRERSEDNLTKLTDGGETTKSIVCTCNICNEKFPHKQHLNRHMRTHGNQKQCMHCSQTFKSRNALDYHLRVLHEDHVMITDNPKVEDTTKPIRRCELQSNAVRKTYSDPYAYSKPILKRQQPKTYVCKLCAKKFVTKLLLCKHQRRHKLKKRNYKPKLKRKSVCGKTGSRANVKQENVAGMG